MKMKNCFRKQALNLINLNKFLNSDEAVSEVLDFIILVGILILSIGLIGVAGYPILESVQEIRHIDNTRQTFVVMAGNINKVVLGQAPSQNIEMKLYDGQFSVTGNSTINITANSFNQTSSTIERIVLVDQQMRSIENTVGDTVVAYEGTGVWVKHPNAYVSNSYKPLITNGSNVIVIPVVKISGTSSVAGSGMSRIKARGEPGITYYTNMSNITVTINSNYCDGWADYFNKSMKWDTTKNDNTCSASFNTSNVDIYILDTQMDVEIE